MAPKRKTVEERFWPKVDKRRKDECWPWKAHKNPRGYGAFHLWVDGKWTVRYASRVSWMIHFGDIPDGMSVLHKCDNPECTNPDHLFLGTQADNARDMANKGRALRGERATSRKLTEKQVLKIRGRYKGRGKGITQAKLAGEYGVTFQQISRITRRTRWKHI